MTKPASALPPSFANVAALPASVTEIAPPPPVTAVLLGSKRHSGLARTLDHLGVRMVVVPPATSPGKLAKMSPFAMALVTPDVLDQQRGVELLQRLRLLNPDVPVLLLSAGGPRTAMLQNGVEVVVDPDDQVRLLATLRAELRKVLGRRSRVLAIGAHPDDIEIGCGGTLLHHRQAGDRITLLTLSRGEVGGSPVNRTEEARGAAVVIGAQLLAAELPDTRISDGMDTVGLIERVVAALLPTVVYVHSEHDGHQDHRAVHNATLSATRTVDTILAYQSPSSRNAFRPTAFVPIEATLSGKLRLLGGFQTQAGRPYLEPEAVAATARYWARYVSAPVRYAEPFEVVRTVHRIGIDAAS